MLALNSGHTIGDISDPGQIDRFRIELPVQNIARYRQVMLAVCCMDKLAPPGWTELVLRHHSPDPIAPHADALGLERCLQATAAVSAAVRHEQGF